MPCSLHPLPGVLQHRQRIAAGKDEIGDAGGAPRGLLLAGPGYERTFRDFNLKLPALTELFLGLSRPISQHGIEVLVGLPVLWLVDAFVLYLLGGWARWEGRLWFWVVTVLLLLTWLPMEVSFLLSYWKLREALSR